MELNKKSSGKNDLIKRATVLGLLAGFLVAYQNCSGLGSFQAATLTQQSLASSQATSSPNPTSGTSAPPAPSPSAAPTAATPTPVVEATPDQVPVYETAQAAYSGTQAIRQSIMIRVGNSKPIEAMLDTGSTGLRVLPGVLTSADYGTLGAPTTYTFGAGQVVGKIANATVTIGKTSTLQPVALQVIDADGIGCPANNPNCALKNSTTPFGFGVNGTPFQAIIGVSLKADILPNPLVQMGLKNWLLTLDTPTSAGAEGSIILNKNSIDESEYKLIQLSAQTTGTNGSAPLWADNQLPTCVINLDNPQSVCYGSSIDTGAFNIRAIPASSAAKAWPAGTKSRLRFTDSAGEYVDTDFQIGADPGSGVSLPTDLSGTRNLNLGPFPLYHFVALYDPIHGILGLKPK